MTVMRRLVPLVSLALFVVSCGTSPATDASPPIEYPVGVVEPMPAPIGSALPVSASRQQVDTRPQYAGFGSLTGGTSTKVALAKGDLEVFATANSAEPFMTMPWTTILGTVTVLTVVDESDGGWLEVMLPIRPNGSTGFVRVEDVDMYTVGGRIVIDISDRTLVYALDGVEVLQTRVAVGSASNPTPTGSFFVTDSVTVANPAGPWGPHALGLSARSDTITEYNGGDGIIGIHGTNRPGSIGSAASLGCVRLPNDIATLLHGMVPIGTPVDIRA